MGFMASSVKAKVLNVMFLLFNFMAWVCCCVSFGGALQVAKLDGDGDADVTYTFYWNYFKSDQHGASDVHFDSDDCQSSDPDYCGKCKTGGRALIALQVFAFLQLMAVMAFTIIRMAGVSISFFQPARKVLTIELGLTAVNIFWFFLAVCIYGGTCFHAVGEMDGISTKGTGFAYLIVCFFFLLANLVFIYLIRADASTHLGSGGDYLSEADSSATNYNPPASYQYNGAGPSAAAYAGSYNGDVQPAPQVTSDNNL